MRVLLVEDNVDSGQSLVMLLRVLGHEGRVCGNAWAAIDQVARWQPELVITDIGLPGTDGYALAPMLRRAGLDDVPIYALSAYVDDPRKREVAGIQGHLQKPISIVDLRRILNTDHAQPTC
ncbi:MAG: response regulator [Planctomycetota bacterium]|nr:response regulator [Planctomycetota bacterium]